MYLCYRNEGCDCHSLCGEYRISIFRTSNDFAKEFIFSASKTLCVLCPVGSIEHPGSTAASPASLVHSRVIVTGDLSVSVTVCAVLVHIGDDCVFSARPFACALSKSWIETIRFYIRVFMIDINFKISLTSAAWSSRIHPICLRDLEWAAVAGAWGVRCTFCTCLKLVGTKINI